MEVLTEDVVKSSAIEGEQLNPDEVRSSIARRLGIEVAGLPTPSRQVKGLVEMILDATQNSEAELTTERLFDWHAALCRSHPHPGTALPEVAWREGGPSHRINAAPYTRPPASSSRSFGMSRAPWRKRTTSRSSPSAR